MQDRNVLVVDDDTGGPRVARRRVWRRSATRPSITAAASTRRSRSSSGSPSRTRAVRHRHARRRRDSSCSKRIKEHDAGSRRGHGHRCRRRGHRVQAIRRGASDYVTKPFNLDEVQIVVERTLEKRRLIIENRAYQEHLEELVDERTQELLEKKREVERLYQELRGNVRDPRCRPWSPRSTCATTRPRAIPIASWSTRSWWPSAWASVEPDADLDPARRDPPRRGQDRRPRRDAAQTGQARRRTNGRR